MFGIRHTNLMSYFGIGVHMRSVCIFVEFIQGESLDSILHRQVSLLYICLFLPLLLALQGNLQSELKM